jgi:hypothetical protein
MVEEGRPMNEQVRNAIIMLMARQYVMTVFKGAGESTQIEVVNSTDLDEVLEAIEAPGTSEIVMKIRPPSPEESYPVASIDLDLSEENPLQGYQTRSWAPAIVDKHICDAFNIDP